METHESTGTQLEYLDEPEPSIRSRGWPKGKPRGPRKQKDPSVFQNGGTTDDSFHSQNNGQINQKPDETQVYTNIQINPITNPVIPIPSNVVSPKDILRNFAINSWNEFISQYDPAGQEYMKNVIKSII